MGRRCRLFVALVALGCVLAPQAAAHAAPFVRIVQTGDPMPAGLAGETVSSTGSSVALSGERALVFLQGDQGTAGLFVGTALADLAMVARRGDPLPGGLPGEEISSFVTNPFGGLDGATALVVLLGDQGTRGYYLGTSTADLALVVDSSTPMPAGLPGETTVPSGLDIAGGVPALRITGTAGTRGVYRGTSPGTLQLVADTATTLPGGAPGETFATFGTPVALDASAVVFSASGTGGSQGAFRGSSPATLVKLFGSGDPFPGDQPGETIDLINAIPSSGGSLAFSLSGSLGSSTLAMWSPSGFTPIFSPGDPFPGGAPGETIASFNDARSATPAGLFFEAVGTAGSFTLVGGNGGPLVEIQARGRPLDGRVVEHGFNGICDFAAGSRAAAHLFFDDGSEGVYVFEAGAVLAPASIPVLSPAGLLALVLSLAAAGLSLLRR